MTPDAVFAAILVGGFWILAQLLYDHTKQLVMINRRLKEIAWRLARQQGEEHWLSEHE